MNRKLKSLSNIINIKSSSLILMTGILLALVLRWNLITFVADDMSKFLLPWYNFIEKNNGFQALKYKFSNYNISYLCLLIFATKLNINPIISIKLISIFFDFVCAYFSYKIVDLEYPNTNKPIIAFLAVLFAPTVFINSAYWGQSDSIYTSCLIACIYFLCIKKQRLSLIAFGLAFSFKLQAMFLSPLLIIALLSGILQWQHFLLIPIIYVATLLPAWLQGRPISELLFLYLSQTETYKLLNLNAPNLYIFISNKFYNFVVPIGLLLTIFIISWFIWFVYKKGFKINTEVLVNLTLFLTLIIPYFLPKMHERYFFPADVSSIIFAFLFPDYFFIPIMIGMISLFAYFPFLIGKTIVSVKALAIFMAFPLLIVTLHLNYLLYNKNSLTGIVKR